MVIRSLGLLSLILSITVVTGCGGKPAAPPPPPPPPKKETPPPPPKKPEPKNSEGPAPIALPKKAKFEPWVVGTAPDPSSFVALSFPKLPQFAITGFAVRPGLGRAVVTIRNDGALKKGGPVTVSTKVTLCDTGAGKALTEWNIPGEHAAIDLSPDGRLVLATGQHPGRGRDTLRMWRVGADEQLKRWSWQPHTVPELGPSLMESGKKLSNAECLDVRWAAFVGNERIVSMSRAGQLRVFNIDGPKAIATIDASPCRPAITPDGTRVAFLAGETLALLEVDTGKVVGTREIGPVPPYPVLAFNPNGKQLAIGGNGKSQLVDMTSGDVRYLTLPKLRVTDTGLYDKPFGWADDRYFYADQEIHDPSFPLPLWDYHGAEHAQFRGWQLWLCVREPATHTYTIRPYKLPHNDAQSVIAAANTAPGTFLLKPGSGVKIDVVGIPLDKQKEVRTALEARLKEIGYKPDASASATLFASLETSGTKQTASYITGGSVVYDRKPATLRLMVNGKDVWNEAWAIAPPFFVQVPDNGSIEEYLDKLGLGNPNFDLFTKAPIPAYIPGPNAPRGAFGSSVFISQGVKDNPR